MASKGCDPTKISQLRSEIVVITGASGCLGFHTLRLLIQEDPTVCEIRCLDLVEPEASMEKLIQEQLSEKNLQLSLEKTAAIRVDRILGDIRDINTVERVLAGASCVIHCAAKIQAWIENSRQDQGELWSVNVCGTETLLRASIRFGISKFVHISSFEAFLGYDTIYYATESTLPDSKRLLFGPSGSTKRQAEEKVRQFSSVKLNTIRDGNNGEKCLGSLQAVILRFPAFYGEFDRHYVTKILEMSKFFSGKLRRMTNIWIRHQPIYVANAAWSIVKAKQRLCQDQSISGEEFHITDETPIEDPFDFVESFLECKGMRLTKTGYPFIPIWILLLIFFALRQFLESIDFLQLFSSKKTRYQEALDGIQRVENDQASNEISADKNMDSAKLQAVNAYKSKRWYDYVTPSTLFYICNSSFLNRTKASLRLHYEPLVSPDEAKRKSLDWYEKHLMFE